MLRCNSAGVVGAAAAAAAAALHSSDSEEERSHPSDGKEDADSTAASITSHTDSSSSRSASLLSALAGDTSLQRLQPLRLANLRSAVTSLHSAIHSETVAHALTLYRYTRLQQKLMTVRRYTRKAAARKLNRWIAAAYSQQWPDLLPRIKHDAHRLFDLFSKPANDDEWWPQLLAEITAAGGRTKHLTLALRTLDCHEEAISNSYSNANRLRLMRYYLLTKQWSAQQIEADLLQEGVIEAALPSPQPPPPPLPLQQEGGDAEQEAQVIQVQHEGTSFALLIELQLLTIQINSRLWFAVMRCPPSLSRSR